MSESAPNTKRDQLRARVRQLILMRETGPKSSAWHAARLRLIWQLHDELRVVDESESQDDGSQITSGPVSRNQ